MTNEKILENAKRLMAMMDEQAVGFCPTRSENYLETLVRHTAFQSLMLKEIALRLPEPK